MSSINRNQARCDYGPKKRPCRFALVRRGSGSVPSQRLASVGRQSRVIPFGQRSPHSHIRPRICTDAPDDGKAEGKEASSPSTTSSAAEENSLDADPDSFRAAVDLKQQGNVLAEQSQ